MTVVKPFLRWAGSKRKQIPHLKSFWQSNHSRYVEPFAGSACLFFALQPQHAILSDLNSELIETYEVVRDHPNDIYDRIICIPRTESRYYKIRSQIPSNLGRIERAVRFVYLNRNCFNGIFRTNLDGMFNVPFATYRAGAFVSREEFLTAAKLLKRAVLRTCDFGNTLRNVKKGDFVYLDPPYAVKSRRVFREYSAKPFNCMDLDRLEEHLNKIDARGADFLVSYADCKEARKLAKLWNSFRIRVRRHIAGFAGARKMTYELLITNMDSAIYNSMKK